MSKAQNDSARYIVCKKIGSMVSFKISDVSRGVKGRGGRRASPLPVSPLARPCPRRRENRVRASRAAVPGRSSAQTTGKDLEGRKPSAQKTVSFISETFKYRQTTEDIPRKLSDTQLEN